MRDPIEQLESRIDDLAFEQFAGVPDGHFRCQCGDIVPLASAAQASPRPDSPAICEVCASPILSAARTIMNRWSDWEADAGQAAQVAQDQGAGDCSMRESIAAVLRDLVEQCAQVCEGRANCRTEQIPIYNEARKCADQIRHNMGLR